MNPQETLAAHVATTPRSWSEPARQKARLAFVDAVGCMLAGARSPATRHAAEAARLTASGNLALAGVAGHLSVTGYALVAGTAAHALDYDDVFEPALSHAGAVLVPAILAASSLGRFSGEDILDAFIIGIDVQAFIAEAVNYDHYSRGWHSTSTIGAPSAAAAVARLLRLDERRASAAISLGISMAAGSKRQFGTDAKPLHAGMAAQAGILSGLLARSGASASSNILAGDWSFQDLYGGMNGPGFRASYGLDGSRSALERCGLWAKPYPCCASTHRPIDAVLALRERHDFSIDDLGAIHATVSPVAAANLMYTEPRTPAEARFSMNHCLAVALLQGTVGPDAFDEETILDAGTDRLRRLVTMSTDTRYAVAAGADGIAERATVVLELRDGAVVEQMVIDPKGHPRKPMDDAAYAGKFRRCAGGNIRDADAEHILEALCALGPHTFDLARISAESLGASHLSH